MSSPFSLIIHNGVSTAQDRIQPPQVFYYEVMRMKQGVVLYLEAHIERLIKSISLSRPERGIEHPVDSESVTKWVLDDLKALYESVGAYDLNIKYIVYEENQCLQRLLFYIPSAYPSSDLYEAGVRSRFVAFTRENPNKKEMNQALSSIRHKLDADDSYDYICYDEAGRMLEGTKTNVFFIVDKTIYTAPDYLVLGGITRRVLLGILPGFCEQYGLEFKLESLNVNDFRKVTSAFFTGTSIGVLPISKIENFDLAVGRQTLLKQLLSVYRAHEAQYIEGKIKA